MNSRAFVLLALLFAAGVQMPAIGQSAAEGEKLLARADHKATIEGDLKGAIEEYRKIAAGAGSSRQLAAEALVRMAECYQKLGDAEARAIFQRVVRDYADVRGALARARAALAALETPRMAAPAGVVSRQIWTGRQVDVLGSISPDGQWLSFVDWESGGDLAVRNIATGEKRRLTNRGEAAVGFALFSRISPDGRSIAYNWMKDDFGWEVRVGPIDGSSHRVIFSTNSNQEYVHAEAWSPDGKLLALLRSTGDTNEIAVVPAAGGPLRTVRDFAGQLPGNALFSPDGRQLAFDVTGDQPQRDIHAVALDGSSESALVEHPADDYLLGWMSDGNLLFASDRTGTMDAWLVAVSGGKAQSPPVLATKDLGSVMTLGLTRAGSLFYSLRATGPEIYRAALDPQSAPSAQASRVPRRFINTNIDPDWSPDGKRVAFISERAWPPGRIGGRVLCVVDIETGVQREFQLPLPMLAMPRWSPDGRSLLIRTTGPEGMGIHLVEVDTGRSSPVVVDRNVHVARWARDGASVFLLRTDYSSGEQKGQSSWIAMRNLRTGQERELFRETSPTRVGDGLLNDMLVSPDGSLLVFTVMRSRIRSILAVPVAGGEPREIFRSSSDFSIPAFKSLTWTPDGREILFLKSVPPAPGGNALAQRAELWAVPVEGGQPRSLGLSADGLSRPQIHPGTRQILYQTGIRTQEVWALENLKR